MAELYGETQNEVSPYLAARQKFYTEEGWAQLVNYLKVSTTCYIGNLSFYTTEEQVYALFSLAGPVRRVVMGINKFTRTPCGFCFVEFYFHKDCMNAKYYINGTKLDDRIIRVDVDPGFEEGRQYGRGKSGGQVREDRRENYDEERGGWAGQHKQALQARSLLALEDDDPDR